MKEYERHAIDPGNEPPLITDGRRGPPDRREISARWLAGTFLTGITSSMLMGVALFAALDGREQLATPPELLARDDMQGTDTDSDISKGDRVVATAAVQKNRDRRRFDVSTMQKIGEREVVRTRPFEYVRMALAADHPGNRKYPAFNALTIFSQGAPPTAQAASTGQIYGAKVESEISLKTSEFPLATAEFDSSADLSADEVENVVRSTGLLLTDGDVQVASLHYVDPLRFGNSESPYSLTAPLDVRIIQENVSVAPRAAPDAVSTGFSEEVIPFRNDEDMVTALANAGYDDANAAEMAEALGKLMNSPRLKAGSVLRIGIESHDDDDRIVRASVYDGTDHLLTVALDDRNQYVPSGEPEMTPLLRTAFDGSAPLPRIRGDLPSVYDGISRAALAYGMTEAMTTQLVKMLAADVDLQATIAPTDQIEAFFSLPEDSDQAGDDSEILYVAATFGGTTRKFYRYRAPDGATEYYDQNGKSARQFLLRKPVPNGSFSSPFGMRRHPILGFSRMHPGVDWAAPRGSPILASGNGVIVKAGWTNGYGNQTIIRHANGYETSYNHQNAIARGITVGARVRQGQVIGFVGSTGLSTGAHLHYELTVNGTKVDPMRIRLPDDKALKGRELEAFKRERQRIDQLLNDQKDNGTKLAATNPPNG